MKINDFAVKITQQEGKIKQVDIAQVKEILAVINKLTFGMLYIFVRILPK